MTVERAGVLDLLLADLAELRIDGGVVGVGSPAVQDPARSEFLLERGVPRIVGALWFFLSVEVIEVAEEFIEPVDRGQELIEVAEVILAELTGSIAEVFHEVGDARIFRLQSDVGTRQADLGQPGTNRRLAGDECGPPRSAALLPVPIGESRALASDAVDVRGLVAHDPAVITTRVKPPDVVAHDDEDIRPLAVVGRLTPAK